jgi:DNA-binding MarR family transcriptional regulator
MAQATNESVGGTVTDISTADLALALFDVVRLSRRSRGSDAIEPAAVAVLSTVERLRPARPSDVAGELHLDLSTVSRHLTRLEDEGHLQRTEDPSDRRSCRVELSDGGRDALFAVLANRAATLDSALSSWNPQDRETLATLLRNLARDLEAAQ